MKAKSKKELACLAGESVDVLRDWCRLGMTKGVIVEVTLKDFPRNRWWFRGNFVISQP